MEGSELRCPVCGKIIGAGKIDEWETRCKHCGNWIYIEKIA